MFLRKKPFLEIVFLLAITAIVYLPHIGDLTYFKDDWYYIYGGYKAGPGIFPYMFSIDRPARGVFFAIYYSLFGPEPFPYHVSAYLWRVLSAIGAFWLFNILWPKHGRFAFFTSLLFALYPGYYWWFSAVEYQPMIASLALQVFSIVFSLKVIQSSNRIHKILYAIGALITGWMYIALVDYAIGMEAFRFLCVFLLVSRDARLSSGWNKFLGALKLWAWNLFIPLGFILWRTFFFTNERKATNIGLQLSGLFDAPLATMFNWIMQSFNSLLTLGILAWVAQFPRFFFGMRLRDIVYGFIVTIVVLLLTFLVEKLIKPENDLTSNETNVPGRDALAIGLAGMALGIVPVIMANRFINLDGFSHYALPASLAAAVALMGSIHALSSRRVQLTALFAIIAFAALAHYSIPVSALDEENAVEKFWWQASWRIPALQAGTTLIINYPAKNIGEDGYGLMEAANMIYFPKPSAQIPFHYNVSAVTLSDANSQDILLGKFSRQIEYRGHTVDFDYGNVLVLSQPTSASCVHVMDGERPLISAFDPGNVILVAPSSNIQNVIVDSESFIPPRFALGAEPEHTWCFYYEKAELASQLENWDEVVSLGEEALARGFHPEDQSEWIPFLQAYAIVGNEARVKQFAPEINADTLLRLQACDRLSNLDVPVEPGIQELISRLYCRNSK